MKFQDIIKQLRQSQFMSQEAFAKEIGVSFTTVNRWETGKSKPSYKAMKTIDDYCKNKKIAFDINKEISEDKE